MTAYEVTDKDNLITDGAINTEAIKETGEGQTLGSAEDITFINEEYGSLEIRKSFAGNTEKLSDEDKNKISFTVEGPQWPDTQSFTYAQMEKGVKRYEDIKLGSYTVTENTGEGSQSTA